MEKRQLNLNAPLISARRYSSPLKSSEIVKGTQLSSRRLQGASEWESEVVMIPAGIPFQWEQSPGRPKDDIGTAVKCTPRLPPARALDAFRRYRSGELLRVPPGGISRFSSGERINDHSIHRHQLDAFTFNDHAVILEKLNESLNGDEGNCSESGHDTYSDALDMLSSEESGALNNLNGVNGDHCSYMKFSGSCGVDTQTRDFMMNRFLQAAKAAVVETPKKPTVVNEMIKPVKKSVSGVITPSPNRNTSNSFPYDTHYADNVECEDNHDRKIPVNQRSGRLSWWILPRFCVKNTLRLLNPLPALKSKKLTPSFPKAVSRGRFTMNSKSGPLDSNGWPAPELQKKRFYSGLLSRDMIGNENKLASDSHYSYKPELSQLRRYRNGNLSPYRNESQMSPFRDGFSSIKETETSNGNKIASSRKIFNAFRNVSKNNRNEEQSVSVMEAVEKTVYIDKSSYRKNVGRRIEDEKAQAYQRTKHLDIDVQKPKKELVKSPLPPPLPNSPSESWLWKTLPSIPSEKAFATRKQHSQPLQKGRFTDPSWESIVKCSNLQRPYSQEFLPHNIMSFQSQQ